MFQTLLTPKREHNIILTDTTMKNLTKTGLIQTFQITPLRKLLSWQFLALFQNLNLNPNQMFQILLTPKREHNIILTDTTMKNLTKLGVIQTFQITPLRKPSSWQSLALFQ